MPRCSVGQGLLCVLAILGVYAFLMFLEPIVDAFLMWLDRLPTEDVRFVLFAIPLALIAGWAARRITGGLA